MPTPFDPTSSDKDSKKKNSENQLSQNNPQNEQDKTIHREGHANTLSNFERVFEEGEEITIPVINEELHIDKEVIESGKIRIIKKVNEEKSTVEVPIKHTEVNVERKPINEYVNEHHQAIRYEGDTMIVSVLKEVVVVQKKILLVEELHINKTQKQEIHTEEVTLKSENVLIERSDNKNDNN